MGRLGALLGLLLLAANVQARDVVIRVTGEETQCLNCDGQAGQPTRTPAPAATCHPDMHWTPFGCRCPDGVTSRPPCPPTQPTARPSPSPQPTVVKGGPWQTGGSWGLAGELQAAQYAWDVVYQVHPLVAAAVYRRTGKPIAPREVWSCGVVISWSESEQEAQQKVEAAWQGYIKPSLAARPAGAPVPWFTCGEDSTFDWASGAWSKGGFCKLGPNGGCQELRPVTAWPTAIRPAYAWLYKQWKAAGGGTVVIPPYLFTMVTSRQNSMLASGKTWLQRAKETEPVLFANVLNWRRHSALAPDVDFPNLAAWKVAKAAVDRWLTKVDAEMKALGVPWEPVLQLSNGAYRDIQAAAGGADLAVWQDRAIVELPVLLKAHGFPANIQQELFAFDVGTADFDCALYQRLKAAGAVVSSWDVTKAFKKHQEGVACR